MSRLVARAPEGSRSLPPALRHPSPGVWLCNFLVLLWVLWNVFMGLRLLAPGLWAGPPPENPLEGYLTAPFTGLLCLLLAGLIGWCQFLAAFRRGILPSYLVGGLFTVVGIVGCLGPKDLVRDTLFGAHLFVGIMMWRWGKRLARRPI